MIKIFVIMLLSLLYITEFNAEFHRHIRSVESLEEEIRAEELKLLLEEQELSVHTALLKQRSEDEERLLEKYIEGDKLT